LQERRGRAARKSRVARRRRNAARDGARDDSVSNDVAALGQARLYEPAIDDIKNDSTLCNEVTLSCRKQPILGES